MRQQRGMFLCLFAIPVTAFTACGQPVLAAEREAIAEFSTDPVSTFRGHVAEVVALVFEPGGTRIVSVSPGDVRTWDSETAEELAGYLLEGGRVVAISPERQMLAMAQLTNLLERGVMVRSLEDGRLLRTFNPHAEVTEETAFVSLVGGLAFSPDGRRLATAGRSGLVGGRHGLPGGVVKLWDTASGDELLFIAGPRPGVSTSAFAGVVTFSPDGRYLVAGTDGAGGELPEAGEVWVWNPDDGKALFTLPTRDRVNPGEFFSSVTALAFAPDSARIAAAVGVRPSRRDGLVIPADRPSELRVWELENGKVVHILRGHRGGVISLAFSPQGRWLASAGTDEVVRVWDQQTGEEVAVLPFEVPRINVLLFHSERQFLLAAGGDSDSGEVRIWRLPME